MGKMFYASAKTVDQGHGQAENPPQDNLRCFFFPFFCFCKCSACPRPGAVFTNHSLERSLSYSPDFFYI